MQKPSPRPNANSEKAAVVALLGLAALLFWLGYTRNPGLKVPYFVAYVCSFTLLMSALALGAKISGRSAANHAFAALTLLGFAAAGAWIAFAPGGPQQCKVGVGRADIDTARRMVDASPSTCRVVIGSGAVVCLLLAAWAIALWWQARQVARD